MTINTTTARVSYIGNDVTVNFAVPFTFFNDADVRAQLVVDLTGVVTEQILNTNFTLVGGVPNGTLTMLVAPPTGTTLVIFSDPTLTQTVDLINNDPLPVETSVERPLDKLTLLVQRSRDLLDRTSRLKDGDTGTTVPFELPLKTIRAGNIAAWDVDGNWIPAASTLPSTVIVTPFAEIYLDDVDDITTRATLDVPGLGADNIFSGFNTFSGRVLSSGITQFTNGIGPQYMNNNAIAAAVASNALTIDLRGRDLTDPSSTNPVEIAFRSEVQVDGDWDIVQIIASLDITAPQGATLGFINSETGFVYVYALNNAGTVELAIAKKALFDEAIRQTTTVLTGASDDDSTLYSTVARTDVPVRLLGRLRVTTGAIAGDWDTAPTELTPWTPGMKKTGDTIQSVINFDGEVSTGTTLIPFDDTIPQITEGDEYMTQAIIPTDAQNTLVIEHIGNYAHSAAGDRNLAAVIFRDSTANGLKVNAKEINGSDETAFVSVYHEELAGSIASTIFRIRTGVDIAGTITFNGVSGGRIYGGIHGSFLKVTEVQN